MRYIYDFRGKLLASGYQLLESDNLIHNYSYDADERLSAASYGVYTPANPVNFMKPLAAYNYYLHGPLKRSVLGNNLQGLDYIYTIDGKLKAMNNPVNSATGSDPGLDGYTTGPHASVSPDAFGFALEYYPGDYQRAGSPIRSYNHADAYSHNLSYTGLVKAQSWRTVLPAAATNAYSSGLMYEYRYDEQYRLTGATFGTITETAPTVGSPMWSNTFTQKPEYKLDNIDYDKNGNLQHLKRYAAPINSNTAHLLDNLTYHYDSSKKNKLKQVGDAATNTAAYSTDLDLPNQSNSSNYVYNSIGELVENKQEGLGYEYNPAGLITRVYELSTHNPRTEYTYNDKGLKYSKTSYSGGLFNIETEQLFYVYDAGGAEVATYKKLVQVPNTVYQLQHHTLYGAGRVGLLDKNTNKALFELSDHLGNVRAVVSANSSGVAETVSYTDYYPHGGTLPGRTCQSSLNFPYGYQGQEKDPATGLTNFELRQYDPRIGRWYNPDPYGQHHSPYLAMSNNPVSFTDPDGGWDGDKGYDDAMGDIMKRNNFNFLAASIEANGQMNWNGMSPADRNTLQGMFGTSYKAQFDNRVMDNIDAFGSYSERGIDYYYSEKRGVYGYWKDENTLTGAVKQFHTSSGNGTMGFRTTGNITIGSKFNRIGGDAVLTNIRLKNQLRDNLMAGLKTVESFNPFSNLWDAASMLTLGTDKYGNAGSVTGLTYAVIGAFPGGNIETGIAQEGKVIGLGLFDDLYLHRGTGAITYQEAGWQKAGLTKVDWGRSSDPFYFKDAFKDAARNASAIKFNVSSFNPYHPKPGLTNFEFDHIIGNPSLLQKTTFVKDGTQVFWNGTSFIR
jgi:RHS repeat-associated protein